MRAQRAASRNEKENGGIAPWIVQDYRPTAARKHSSSWRWAA